MKKKKVLAICSFNNTAQVFLDVYDLFVDSWEPYLILLFSEPKIENKLREQNIEYSVYPQTICRTDNKVIKLILFMVDDVKNYFNSKKILNSNINPDIVFSFDGSPFGLGKWLVREYRENGKITFRYAWGNYSSHGQYAMRRIFRWYLYLLKFDYSGVFTFHANTEYTLTRTEKFRKVIKSYKINSERIHVVGYHLIDKLENIRKLDKFNTQKLNEGNKILILTQPLSKEKNFVENLKVFVDAFLCENKYDITIKFHPRDNVSDYKSITSKKGVQVIRHENRSADTDILITEADYVVGYYSTTLMHAIYLGKKTIFLELSENCNKDFYKEYLYNFRLFKKDEATELLRIMKEEPDTLIPKPNDKFEELFPRNISFKDELSKLLEELESRKKLGRHGHEYNKKE